MNNICPQTSNDTTHFPVCMNICTLKLFDYLAPFHIINILDCSVTYTYNVIIIIYNCHDRIHQFLIIDCMIS